MTAQDKETAVFCEGYHDRAFWAGMLLREGCTDPGDAGRGPRSHVHDPSGKRVAGQGHFGFRTKSGGFVRVVPVGGHTRMGQHIGVEHKLARTRQHVVQRLVISVDGDAETTAQALVKELAGKSPEVVLAVLKLPDQQLDPAVREVVPAAQTLERVVVAALAATFPERAQQVANWLQARSDRPRSDEHKAFAWSHMAGWYAGHGCEDFYRHVWRDTSLAENLERLLEASGVWSLMRIVAA